MSKPGNPDGPGTVLHLDADSALDLVHELLPREAEAALLDHLRVCPTCEATLKELVAERERLRARSARRGRRRWPVWTAAASLPLAAGLAIFLLRPAPVADSRLFRLPAADTVLIQRTDIGDEHRRDLQAGFEAYTGGDLERAVDVLSRVETAGPLETLRRVYLGNALAFRGEYERAAAALEPVAEATLPEPWGREARWSYWVALDGMGSTVRADSLLQVLSREPNEVGDRARQALQERSP